MMRRLLATLILLGFVLPAFAQTSGEAVEVKPSAEVAAEGAARKLVAGGAVASGDTVRTNASGQVQLLFQDETKIVVGASSELKIVETLFRKNGKARKFAANALGGSFRFISGKSDEKVFKLATPLATLGIRGTAFDYTVSPERGTDLLVFEGLVRFCTRDNRCVNVPGGCQAATILLDGTFTQPQTTEEKRALLLRSFPLLADQSTLRPDFRTSTDGCRAVRLIRLPSEKREQDRIRRTLNDNGSGNDRDNPADGPSDSPGNDGNPAD